MSLAVTEAKKEASFREDGFVTLQRVILPELSQMDTALLYVDTGAAATANLNTMNGKEREGNPSVAIAQPTAELHAEDFIDRVSARIRSGSRLSFGSYFNAFPASYWRRWTVVESIRLSLETSGTGTVIVYKSNARGSLQRVASTNVTEANTLTKFDLTLAPFGDGGWYWFDLVGGSDGFTLNKAEWQTESDRSIDGSVTIEITTLNKVDFCLRNLQTFADNPNALEHVKELLIVDQGTTKLVDDPGYPAVAAKLQGKLRVIHQGNLGGSGGFSRGMLESVDNGSDFALLLDDDVAVEPESINRLLTFAQMCKKPTIVGGHMFDLYNRTVLHTFGEVVNPYRIQPDLPTDDAELGHDFAITNLRQTSWLHRRTDVDYNGWWMCMIPTEVIREIGLSLPIFIKWDDAEYGLRARNHGFNTVSLPGAAVWHVSWIDKDDLVGWQAYFHTRNRLIVALLHSPYDIGGRVLRETFQLDIKHLISMQYFTVRGRVMALRDLVAGPEKLPGLLPKRLPEIRALAKEYSDSVFKNEIDDFPAPKLDKPPRKGGGFKMPNYAQLLPWTAKTVIRQVLKPVKSSSKVRPQALIAHQDNKWWRMSQYDSAVVSNAEGTALSWYQRDRDELRRMLAESAKLHAEILRNWSKMREEYRQQAATLTSLESWRTIFSENQEPERS